MDFSEVSYERGTPFDSYGPGFFRLDGKIYEGNLVLSPVGLKPWGGLEDSETILSIGTDIDFVLLGTGEAMLPVPARLRAALEGAGIGVEPMATATACRTFNVLLGEGRRVGAAVLAL
ncbi:Mth938-like domain-containing protein [Tropicimonas sp. TH_r6]|uniref:Mth938-like domain-containing protein n=1 Tax=Tropicimonas sp. TH_r6 TaxID=3082085 RepID=UPI0029559B30|nr:Mth938-like domain-containing protein [Tropicimonas sp. TH_r6]MDV7144936.1 Mth938-like domain-containing protein [Tropicimonas sp. TH_r6]